MPFRVNKAGVIECDTPEEAIALQQRITQAAAQHAAVSRPLHVNGPPLPRVREYRSEQSNRDKVLSVITKNWATIERIATETGLDVKQVRGVMSAPAVGTRLARRGQRGEREYLLQTDDKQEAEAKAKA